MKPNHLKKTYPLMMRCGDVQYRDVTQTRVQLPGSKFNIYTEVKVKPKVENNCAVTREGSVDGSLNQKCVKPSASATFSGQVAAALFESNRQAKRQRSQSTNLIFPKTRTRQRNDSLIYSNRAILPKKSYSAVCLPGKSFIGVKKSHVHRSILPATSADRENHYKTVEVLSSRKLDFSPIRVRPPIVMQNIQLVRAIDNNRRFIHVKQKFAEQTARKNYKL